MKNIFTPVLAFIGGIYFAEVEPGMASDIMDYVRIIIAEVSSRLQG
jgi:hypothetical protein